jgi:hypothetical protein
VLSTPTRLAASLDDQASNWTHFLGTTVVPGTGATN